jgi:glutamate dehydrogenase
VRGEGLFRPELAVVFAYSKLLLKDLMSNSFIVKDSAFKQDLLDYFPSNLSRQFAVPIEQHRLRDEIIVNQLVNSLVNRLGPSFAFKMRDETGASIDRVVKNYKVACNIFNVEVIWADIEGLDNKVSPAVQITMLMGVRKLIERAMYWLQRNRSQVDSIEQIISEFADGVSTIGADIVNCASQADKKYVTQRITAYKGANVGAQLAEKIVCLEFEFMALDIIAVHTAVKQKKDDVLPVYSLVSEVLKLSWLNGCINRLPRKNYWQSLARSALREDLHAENRALLTAIFQRSNKKDTAAKRVSDWCANNRIEIDRYLHLLSVIQAEGDIEIEQLSVILKELHAIVEKSKLK